MEEFLENNELCLICKISKNAFCAMLMLDSLMKLRKGDNKSMFATPFCVFCSRISFPGGFLGKLASNFSNFFAVLSIYFVGSHPDYVFS